MPTYEYACRACGHTFDVVRSIHDPALTECPQCGGELRKVFAPPAIAFKGSGFYATDHGKKAKKPEKAASGAAKPSKNAGDKGASGSGSGDEAASGSGSGDKMAGSESGTKKGSA